MSRVLIREGSSGILELSGLGSRGELVVPDCDLDKALGLLFALYDLKDARGRRFQDNYRRLGFNWLSSQVGFIYWRCCYRFVQYRSLLARCMAGKVSPHFATRLNFARLWELFHPRGRPGLSDRLRYERTLPKHNQKWAASQRGGMLFYRYGPNDFRTREMLAHFEAKSAPFSFVYSPSGKLLRARDQQPHPVYFLHRHHLHYGGDNGFGHSYDLSKLPPLEAAFLEAVIRRVEQRMTAALTEHHAHLACLSQARPELFFGLDDHNEIYPILYACKALGIPCIGYQLGMYARLQAAYTLERWQPGSYDWYDKVIVWGPYWEELQRRHSQAYPEDFFLPGTNKHAYDYTWQDSPRFNAKNVLVPYEFFANTWLIGRYIQRLIDAGYSVFLKLKPDEQPERQLASYCLEPEYLACIRPVHEITPEFMAEINIVAGAMTTLLYDLLPYGKHTWVFETEFRLLDDMVRDGYARMVRLDEIESMPMPERARREIDASRLFGPTPLGEVLDRHVLSRLGC